MEPFEIMVSESQERMLCVVEPDTRRRGPRGLREWEVNATAIGEVTDTRRLRVFDGDALVGDMPVTALVDECPVYDLEPVAPSVVDVPGAASRCSGLPADPGETAARAAAARANLASRRWAFEQYDCLVGSRTVRRPEAADAAVLADWPGGSAIAVSIDGNGRRVACDPYRGAVEAVLECCGQPRLRRRRAARPDELPQLRQPGEAAHRLAAHARGRRPRRRLPRARRAGRRRQRLALQRGAARARSTRRRSSAWSASCRRPRAPAASASRRRATSSRVISAGSWAPAATGSELAKLRGEAPFGELPQADLGELRALHAAVRQAVRAGALRSAHDVAEGGLAVALAEAAWPAASAPRVDLAPLRPAGEALLFGEGPGAFVVSGPAQSLRAFGGAARVIGDGRRRRAGDRRRSRSAVELGRAHDRLGALLH